MSGADRRGGASGSGAELGEDPRADLRWGTVPRLLEEVAGRLPDTDALVDGERRLTFSQLAGAAGAVSAGLMASGIAGGDRVAIWAPNSAQWVVGALGALGAGAVLVTVNTRFKGGEAAHVLRASGARTLLTHAEFLGVRYPELLVDQDVGELAEVVLIDAQGVEGGSDGASGPPSSGCPVPVRRLADLVAAGERIDPASVAGRGREVQPGDLSDVLFTSGTTGRPKGAGATHGQSLRTFGAWASIVGLGQADRYLVVNPFFHTFGYKAGILACLMTGATLIPEPVFDVDRVLERIERERVSVLPGPPTLYQSLLAHPRRHERDVSSLRLGVTGAAAVPVELVVAMKDELGFDTVLTAYGLTESCGTVTMCRRDDPPELVATTSGRAIPDLEVRVVGSDGEVSRGEPGEIVVRGYTVMGGYWDDAEATAQAIDEEGWLHTGDIGRMDEAGYVTVTDRLKDMYVVGGFNAYPAEIEDTLRRCPLVDQVAVVGVDHERLGEVGCAFVVPAGEPGPSLEREVIAWARGAMANYKVPRYVEAVGALPLNASGKVLKRELRRRFADRRGSEQEGDGGRRPTGNAPKTEAGAAGQESRADEVGPGDQERV